MIWCQRAELVRPLFFRPADTRPVNIHDLVINASFVCSGWRPSGHAVLSGPLPERTAARRLVGASSQHVCFYISQTFDRRENRFPLRASAAPRLVTEKHTKL